MANKATVNSNRLKMTTLMVIPDHMTQLKVVAQSQGLNSSAVIRMLIVQYLRRAVRQRK